MKEQKNKKMILAIDVGNTNIVIGGCDDREKIIFKASIATDHSKTYEQYSVEINSILELFNVDSQMIEGSIISCVVPPLTNVVKKAVNLITGTTSLIVGPGIKTGLNIKIDNPAQLGSDLAVGAVASLDIYTPPIIVFDLGTATTASVIDTNRNFLGGIIFPGINVSLEALFSQTSQLPKISLENPGDVIGRNTVDSMKSGIVYGNASMIDGIADRIEAELGEEATIIATGGLAETIVPYSRKKIIVDPDLMIKGLYLIYLKNL